MRKKLTKSEIELLERSGYPKKAINYYVNMTNFGHMPRPDVSLAYTGSCGDSIMFYLKIKGNSLIEDVKFQYLGCPGAASSASALTELAQGRTIDEARKITEKDVIQKLGGLPEAKSDCVKLTVTAFRKTIEKYEEHAKKG